MDAQRHGLLSSFGLLILRLGVGGYMVLGHGWGKMQSVLSGNFTGVDDAIGLGAVPSTLMMTFAEFVCALLVMAGFVTRLAAVPLVIGLAVAAFVAHGGDPWTLANGLPSKEPALLFLVPFLALIFTGAGRLSIDALIWPRWRQRRANRRAAA